MTDFLYNNPSFVGGVATVLDLFGSLPAYNSSKSPAEADKRAHFADLLALKNDMKVALAEISDYAQK